MSSVKTDHPYWSFLHKVDKPARYVGGEYNSIRKESARVRMCLAFPDVYDIGMSHLGTKILYSIINGHPELAVERAFCPWFDMERELRQRELPVLSLESALPLSDFDVLGFSLQYEMTFTNILTMLDLCGIPFRSQDRTLSHPLIVAGGPTATHPEPIAPFMDAIVVGDAEEALPALLREVGRLNDSGATRLEQLVALSHLEGVYVPSLYDTYVDARNELLVVGEPLVPGVKARIERAFVEDIDRYPFPTDSPEPVAEAIFDRVSIEIARGCTEGCRFCQAGMIYRPVRERSPEAVVSHITDALATGGYDEVSLTSLSTADYSCISPLIKRVMERLRPQNVSLSVSSLRAYGLDEDLLDEMASVRATGLTFAPEAGTQRMRDVVNKNITEEDIFTTCERVFSRGWKKVKLYFMIGLPTETDEDVVGIAEMGRQALEIGRTHQKGVYVTVSVSSHVPKPHTPFQWCAMDSIEEVERKQGMLIDLSRQMGLKFRRHNVKVSHLEGIIARGDRRTADLIELAWRKGARFDSWDDHLDWEAWQQALDEWEASCGVRREWFLMTLPLDGRLPWDHIDVGLADGFLAKEYKKAVANRLSPPCGKPFRAKVHHTNLAEAQADERKLICYHCGVACDMTQMRQERFDYLEQLGAVTRPEPKQGPSDRERAHNRYRRGLAPRIIDRGEDARYRIRYTKLGQVALMGHLDVVRMLPRIFKRAGISVCYSQGFHPKPIISYGPALGLGIRSGAELAELRVVEGIEPLELLQRLSKVTPDGLQILQAVRVDADQPKLSKLLKAQDYLVFPPTSWLIEHLGDHPERWPELLETRCARVLAAESIPIERERKGRLRAIEGRPGLLGLEVVAAGAWPDVLESSAPLGVLIRLALDDDRAVAKPSEIASVVLGEGLSHADMARGAVWNIDESGALVDPLQADRPVSRETGAEGAKPSSHVAQSLLG